MVFCIITPVYAQLKPRPDAFPPVPTNYETKAISMATTLDEMADWDRYPTYETYLSMMARWVNDFPTLCHIDTIGTSIQGRLILSLYIEVQTDDDLYRPEFFYSATMHGDELTGYIMMLHLIDTLLHGYGTNTQYTDLINRTRISINPLANPDGTYYRGNHTVQGAQRYNANGIDLNRTFPDPFAITAKSIPQENQAMIDYLSAHQFRLSANLHGGAEVMNYPWDSFQSRDRSHPAANWWKEVCRRFVDTSRVYNRNHFRDVTNSGYIVGGDWYIIDGGRQDYVNYYHNCLELTMELSSDKTLSSNQLNNYWSFLQHPLVNYISEIHNLPENVSIDRPQHITQLQVYPNPTTGHAILSNIAPGTDAQVFDITGTPVGKSHDGQIDLSQHPEGVYIIRVDTQIIKLIKQ